MELRFDTAGAGEYVGAARRTLEKWRVSGFGPEFIKVGSKVYYEKSALDSWLQSRRRRSTSDPGPTPCSGGCRRGAARG